MAHTVKKDVIKVIFSVVQNLGVLYQGKNLIDALTYTVKKDVIKCIFPVVQNLGVLYQGKKLSREEEECQHLLSSKGKIHCQYFYFHLRIALTTL